MAFEPEINHLAHAKLSYVKPEPKAQTLAGLSALVKKAFPKDTIGGYNISTSPDISYQIYLQDKTVFIDQYSGEILGTTIGADGWDNFQNFIHQLHLRLAFRNQGDTGKTIMSWAGVGLFIILPSGLILWWRQKRIAVRWKAKSRLVWFDIHSLVGVTVFIILLILSFTGIMIGFEQKTTPLFYQITGSKPNQWPDFNIKAQANASMISPDSALTLVRQTLPGVEPFNINVPGPTDAYQVRARYPEDRTPGGRSMVFLDPYNGKVLFAEGSRTAPGGKRLVNINRAIHTGDIYGLPTKIIMSLASLLMVVQVVSGLTMWWKRRKKKGIVSE